MVDVHDLDAAAQPIRNRLQPLLLNEVFSLPARKTFVKRLLGEGEMSLWYGEPGAGKSFLLTDLGLHVAHGWPWFTRKVEPGLVVYIAAEGSGGFRNRLDAFFRHHERAKKDAPFTLIPEIVDLLNDADVGPLVAEINRVADQLQHITRFIIVDTLSRCLAGGNENGPDDMGAFIANCDRLRMETGGHVAIIHHDGKDGTKGARGHSSLYGAVDTQVRISKSAAGNIATVTKQKDDEDGAVFGFRLEKVILGEDEDGEPITSCIIGPSETKPGGNSISLSDAQQIALNQLIKAIGHEGKVPPASNHIPPHKPCVTEKTWRTYCVSGGISSSDNKDSNRKAFKRSADRLVAIELVAKWKDFVWVTS